MLDVGDNHPYVGIVALNPFLPRLIEPSVNEALTVMPVTVVTGARQTGKSTLVGAVARNADRHVVSLDDLGTMDRARNAPDELLTLAARVTIDEVQREPDLLLAIKRAVDANRQPGQFLLTGSANLLLMRAVSESLAGRASYVTLWPMTRREQLGLGTAGIWSALLDSEHIEWKRVIDAQSVTYESWMDLAKRGGYPTPALELNTDVARRIWFDGYATTYLERDLRDLAAIDRLTDFRRLMIATALRIGGIQQQANLARDVGMSPTTVQRYLDLLEVSYQLVRIPAFSVNRTKRLIKSPKLYWSDAGLALHLAGEVVPRGAHLENLVATDLLAWTATRRDRPSILHWRTTKGAEVDFVVETSQHVLPIEVKASPRLNTKDAQHLESFLDEYATRAQAGLIVYDGTETFWLTRRVLAAPWWKVM